MFGMPAVGGAPSGLGIGSGNLKPSLSSDPFRQAAQKSSEGFGNSTQFGLPASDFSVREHEPEPLPDPDPPRIERTPTIVQAVSPEEDPWSSTPPAPIDAFDPLDGFAGAKQPAISSLIDEEVEDLSTSLFGDDFSFGGGDFGDDDDDDDWDDDFDDDFDDDDDDEDDFDDDAFEQGFKSGKSKAAAAPAQEEEDEVEHDPMAAFEALSDMMADLEDVMPTEDEAAAALGLDEGIALFDDSDGSDEPVVRVVHNEPEPVPARPEPVPAEPEPVPARPEPIAAEPIAAKPQPEAVPTKPEPTPVKAPEKKSNMGMVIVILLIIVAVVLALVFGGVL